VSAKFNWMLERELTGLRYSYEEAGPIIEDLDPLAGAGRAALPVTVQPIQPRPRSCARSGLVRCAKCSLPRHRWPGRNPLTGQFDACFTPKSSVRCS
jgi:hypothetical protein